MKRPDTRHARCRRCSKLLHRSKWARPVAEQEERGHRGGYKVTLWLPALRPLHQRPEINRPARETYTPPGRGNSTPGTDGGKGGQSASCWDCTPIGG